MDALFTKVLARGADWYAQALGIWSQGGWGMFALAAIGLVMFWMGFKVLFDLRDKGIHSVPEDTWREWIDHPQQRRGPVGALLDRVAGMPSIGATTSAFDQVRSTECVGCQRDLRVMKICVSAAPLVGLLGTVTGMLSTFGALATGGGGDKTMGMVAAGISEALITTETGLVIALPGLFFQYALHRRFQMYEAFLAHVEVVCNQQLQVRLDHQRRQAARAVARERIQRALRRTILPNNLPIPTP